jgi:Fur family peroxide stress response transcriptional regulator
LQQFEVLCRQRGLALTVQRRRILELILGRKDHPTADQIFEGTKKQLPDISRTTVYRVLDTLVDVGVITRASSRGAATRFDPVADRHHHCICTHCEKLIDIDDGQFAHRVELPDTSAVGFEIHDFCVQFSGICAACRRKMGRRGAPVPEAGKPARGKAASGSRTGQRRNRRTKGRSSGSSE